MISQELFSQAKKLSSSKWALALDTSSFNGAMTFFNSSEVLRTDTWGKEKRHSENLILDFSKSIEELNLDIKNLSEIYLGIGPGSFTGIRVSTAFVKGIAFANNCFIYSFPSLRILAAQASKKTPHDFNVISPSIGNLVFLSQYSKINNYYTENIAYQALSIEEVLKYKEPCFTSDESLANTFNLNLIEEAKDSLTHCLEFSQNNTMFLCHSKYLDLFPLYLRLSEAEEKYRKIEAKI